MDYPSGAGSYDIGYGCPCLDPTASNYCPDCEMDTSDDTSNPCDYSVPTCDDESACNYGAEGDCSYAEEGFDCDGNALDSACATCAAAGGFYCGDDESNWTSYSPEGCVPSYYIGDGWEDCGDATDEVDGASYNCDPFEYVAPVVATCDDASACNYGAEGDCAYAPEGYDCDGNVQCGSGQLEIVATFNDAYGDGWNGAIASVYFDGVLFDPAGVGFTYTMVDGSTDTQSFCVDQTGLAGCLQIVVGGGSWDSEISWSLVDGATGGAAFALSGGAETIEINCEPACTTVSLDLVDSYGDGWNGGFVSFDGTDYTIEDGDAASYEICVDLEGCTDIIYTAGSWSSENSWSVSDADGNVLGAFGNESGYVGNCETPGCMDADDCNYNPDATADDGSCGAYDDSTYSCYYYVWVMGGYDVATMEGYGYDCTCVVDPVVGCMDETACNYDESANTDDGSK